MKKFLFFISANCCLIFSGVFGANFWDLPQNRDHLDNTLGEAPKNTASMLLETDYQPQLPLSPNNRSVTLFRLLEEVRVTVCKTCKQPCSCSK